jgi:hypothetical protein
MGAYEDILTNLIEFVVFAVCITLIIGLILKIYLKKYKFTTRKSTLYGMLYRLDNKSITAVALVTLNYLFLTWCAMTTTSMNAVYISIIVLVTLLSNIIAKDYVKIPVSLVIAVINCFALHIVHFVHLYLLGEVSDILLRISIFFIVAFVYIYFTYNYINDVNDIVQKNEHIQKKKRKVGVKNAN